MKQFIFLMTVVLGLHAADDGMLLGQWNSVTSGLNNGTQTTEKEYLKFNTDYTFDVVFLVTVQKGNSYVKDLRIEGTGIWKTRGNILVVVVNNVKVPVAGEVYGISQASLEGIAATFHNRFKNDPIRILVMKKLNQATLVTENKRKQVITYTRQQQ
jgi:hypothetical protein